MPRSLIRELMLSEFELGHNATETTKNTCCAKGGGSVDHNKVTRCFEKFCSVYKNHDYQARSSGPRIVDSEIVLQTVEENLASSTCRVSGELGISQFCVFRHLHNFSKSIRSCRIVTHVTEILQNF